MVYSRVCVESIIIIIAMREQKKYRLVGETSDSGMRLGLDRLLLR